MEEPFFSGRNSSGVLLFVRCTWTVGMLNPFIELTIKRRSAFEELRLHCVPVTTADDGTLIATHPALQDMRGAFFHHVRAPVERVAVHRRLQQRGRSALLEPFRQD